MIISVWRYSHLCLALLSFVTLTIAATTGIILAFEPVNQQMNGYKAKNFQSITLAEALPVIKSKFPGIQEITVDDNQYVLAKYTDQNDQEKNAYIDPVTGQQLGIVKQQAAVFTWATTLHRSLFLHETGRMIMGITSFLLILIAITGIALIIKRQKHIRRFFAPIEKTSFAQYYHTVFGRLSLFFILAIALTGTYLSISRFVIKPTKSVATVDESRLKEEPVKPLKNFAILQEIKITQVEKVLFPFSDFPEDYYTLQLKDRELCVNQFTGDILGEQSNSSAYNLAAFSLRWHTGRSGIVWAILMAITCAYILFFIYSGLFIAWKRIRSRSKNKKTADDCTHIILVGSENGGTFEFASAIYQQLLQHGINAYLADLNTYRLYPKATHFIIMTSTYGDGDAPSNASKFLQLITACPQQQTIQFSVIGFGSRNYTRFCQFAHDVHHTMIECTWATPVMDLVTVDDKSIQDFSNWMSEWTAKTGFALTIPRRFVSQEISDRKTLQVISRTATVDNAFMVQLKAKNVKKFHSGDLLAVYPKNDHRERLYSIGKVNGNIQLSVKYIEHGLGSSFLYKLETGTDIQARIIKNKHFHFPDNASHVIMICNGTGIAPFLGMLDENDSNIPCTLYCGFRTRSSFLLYQEFLNNQVQNKKLKNYHLALSREEQPQYVYHLLERDQELISYAIADGATLMICGSLSMEKDVMIVLEKIGGQSGVTTTDLLNTGRIKTDCY